MEAIAIVNQKGGVGKSTVTLGLAAAAADRGVRTLVVDLDPQCNATSGLGYANVSPNIDDALAADAEAAVAKVTVEARWPLGDGLIPDLAPATPALANRESQLATDPIGAQDRLRLGLKGLDYDLVLIDCPPSLGLLTVNGLFAADRALVVTEPAAWASDGVEQVLRTIERIGARRPTPLGLAGIIVNKVGRTRDAKYWHAQLTAAYPTSVIGSVDLRAAIAEASAMSAPVRSLGKRPGAAESAAQFDALAAMLLNSSPTA